MVSDWFLSFLSLLQNQIKTSLITKSKSENQKLRRVEEIEKAENRRIRVNKKTKEKLKR